MFKILTYSLIFSILPATAIAAVTVSTVSAEDMAKIAVSSKIQTTSTSNAILKTQDIALRSHENNTVITHLLQYKSAKPYQVCAISHNDGDGAVLMLMNNISWTQLDSMSMKSEDSKTTQPTFHYECLPMASQEVNFRQYTDSFIRLMETAAERQNGFTQLPDSKGVDVGNGFVLLDRFGDFPSYAVNSEKNPEKETAGSVYYLDNVSKTAFAACDITIDKTKTVVVLLPPKTSHTLHNLHDRSITAKCTDDLPKDVNIDALYNTLTKN